MEPILVENYRDFKTGELVGKLYLSEKATKKVKRSFSQQLKEEDIRSLVLKYYEPVFKRGEFIKQPFSDEEIRITPDTFNLEPIRDAVDRFGFTLPIIELGSKMYDEIFVAKGVGFDESVSK